MSARRGISAFCVLVVAAIVGPLLATPSHAYTQDQQQLCTGDAFRLCGSAIPDVDRVTACMIQNRASLSPGCAQFFHGPVVQQIPVSARKKRKARKPLRAN